MTLNYLIFYYSQHSTVEILKVLKINSRISNLVTRMHSTAPFVRWTYQYNEMVSWPEKVFFVIAFYETKYSKTLYYPTDAKNKQFVDTIKIIIKYLKLSQHVSDHKGSIIWEFSSFWLKLQ